MIDAGWLVVWALDNAGPIVAAGLVLVATLCLAGLAVLLWP